jgi:tetratricopeptide (TPR) repeat protein
MAGLTVFYVGLLWKMQGGQFGQEGISPVDNPLAAMPAGWRILNAVRVAWKYFALQVYPVALSCDYSFNQLPVFRDWRHTLPAALAAVAAVSAWIWALQKKKAGWAIAGAIYFAGFAVTANILMPTGTILGERLAYLPSAGFCLLLALGWNWIREKKETAAWALLAAFVLLLSARTVMRNRDWQDALALFSSGVQAAPNDAKMHANLAGQYFIRNQLDQAALEYQTALRIVPDSPDTLAAYAALEFQQGHLEAAGGMMEKALRLSDRNFLNYDFMVVTYAAILRKTNRADRALESLNQETKESPWYAPAWSERAELHVQRGELDAGRADAEMGLRLNPQDAQAQYVLQLLNASAKSPAAAPQH